MTHNPPPKTTPGTRGQSTMIGTVLLIGIVLVASASILGTVVPDQGDNAEFDTYQTAQNDLIDLRNDVLTSYGTGGTHATSISFAIDYPVLVRQFGMPSGSATLEASAEGSVEIATESDGYSATDDIAPGSTETTILEYRPEFMYHTPTEPLYFEHGVVHGNDHPRTNQPLLNGNQIQLLNIEANLGPSTETARSYEVIPGSVSTQSVADPDEIRMPTTLSEETWGELLADQPAYQDHDVTDGTLTLSLDPDAFNQYQISYGTVGIGTAPPGGPAPPPRG